MHRKAIVRGPQLRPNKFPCITYDIHSASMHFAILYCTPSSWLVSWAAQNWIKIIKCIHLGCRLICLCQNLHGQSMIMTRSWHQVFHVVDRNRGWPGYVVCRKDRWTRNWIWCGFEWELPGGSKRAADSCWQSHIRLILRNTAMY